MSMNRAAQCAAKASRMHGGQCGNGIQGIRGIRNQECATVSLPAQMGGVCQAEKAGGNNFVATLIPADQAAITPTKKEKRMSALTQMKFASFAEFYPAYLAEHANRTCRQLHFAGSTLALIFLTVLVLTGNPWWLLAAVVSGYGFAWIGYFWFEKNRPAPSDSLCILSEATGSCTGSC